MEIPFRKMHGLGNDFVVIDARAGGVAMDAELAAALADRRTGIGCDQLVVLDRPTRPDADVFVHFFNAGGSRSSACGNATRCVGSLMMEELGRLSATVETDTRLLPCEVRLDGQVTVDMGPVATDWQEIPLAEAADTLHVPVGVEDLTDAVCCSIGNPHATFFVTDPDAVELGRLGPLLETHAAFPERANIGVAAILSDGKIRLRVWERGTGLTLACGSGACAALVAANRRGLSGREAEIVMERGSLRVTWREDGNVLLTGPVATSFTGSFDPARFARAAGTAGAGRPGARIAVPWHCASARCTASVTISSSSIAASDRSRSAPSRSGGSATAISVSASTSS